MDMHSVGLFANLASELWHLETLPWKFPDVAWEPSWESCLKTLPGKLSWNIPAIFLGCGRRPQYGKSQFIFPACQWWIDQRKKTPANPGNWNAKFWRQRLLQNLRHLRLELHRIKTCQRLTGCKEKHVHCRRALRCGLGRFLFCIYIYICGI